MKLKIMPLAALSAFMIGGSVNAAKTVLLTDNFNTASNNPWTFNDHLAADQSGTLTIPTPITYSTSSGNDYEAQHSNGGNMLLTSDGWGGWGAMASPNHNFATDANTANQPLEIQFDMWSIQGDAPDWIGFGLNSGQGQLFYEGAYGFAATVGNGKHNYRLVISDTVGTGSGFNGIANGAKIEFFKDNVWQQTITETLGTSDGYMTFRTIPSQWGGWNIGHVDNLSVSLVPEPGAALLGGLGMLALLRRKRLHWT